jgi:hypothetical protein
LNKDVKLKFDLNAYPRTHHLQNQPKKIVIPRGESIKVIEHPFEKQPNDSLIMYKNQEWVVVKSSLDEVIDGSMYAKGGHVVGRTLKFKDYNGDIRTGEIIEVLNDGDYSVRSGMTSVLVTPTMIIKFEKQPVRKKMFGLFEDGGNINSNIIVIYVNEYPYYLKKAGDTTHLYMANSREGVDTNV